MYYTEKEIEIAIEEATRILTEKSKTVKKFTYGYNDCFSFLVEYDKALRKNKTTKLQKFFNCFGEYKDPKEWLANMKSSGFDDKNDLALHIGYEPAKQKRPKLGDIACQMIKENVGIFMVAGKTHWVSTCPSNNGIYNTRRILPYETQLLFLATPLRS